MINDILAQLAFRARATSLVVATTGSTSLAATSTGYTRSSGSFVSDGFVVGMEITAAGFGSAGNNGVKRVTKVQAGTLTVTSITGGNVTESAGSGRSLLAGLPLLRAWENIEFTPISGRPYVAEEWVPGGSSVITWPEKTGIFHEDGLSQWRFYGLPKVGVSALRATVTAFKKLFTPGTFFNLSDGTTVAVRGDTAVKSSHILPAEPGWVVCIVSIPWQTFTRNATASTAARYVVTPGSLTPVAGSTVALSAQLVAAGGDPVATAGLLVTWDVSGAGGTLGSVTSLTDEAGIATNTLTVSTNASVSHVVSVIDSASRSGASPLIDVQPDVAAAIVLIPTAVTLDVDATRQLTATVQDQYGNATGDAAAFASADEGLVTVSGSGVATAVAETEEPVPVVATFGDLTSNQSVVSVVPDTPAAAFDGPAELPREYLQTALTNTPAGGATIPVLSGGDLQAALNIAVPGDVIELAAGSAFDGNYTLPVKTGGISGAWIWITTAGTLPAEGSRMTPSLAASHNIPKIRSPNSNPALRTGGATAKWRIMGIETGVTDTSVLLNSTFIALGDGTETSVEALPSNIIIDRCYLNGHPALDCRRAVTFNASRLAIIESWVADIHSTFDAQAIYGANGPGPYKIVNNRLAASTEVIAFGGGGCFIAGQNPSDIEIRRNHITKTVSWKTSWLVKNLFEFKAGVRVLIEGNVCENSPVSAQAGWAFIFQSVNQPGTNVPWAHCADVTCRYNLVVNVSAGFGINGKYYSTSSPLTARLSIHDNVFIGVANATIGGGGRLFQILDGLVDDLSIEHNTLFTPNGQTLFFGENERNYKNLKVKNNLTGGGAYNIFVGGAGIGTPGWTAVAGPGAELQGNVIVLLDGMTSANYPSGNSYPLSFAAVGLVGGGSAALSVTASLADLALAPSSPYKGTATDDTDPGADIAAVAAATLGVVIP